MTEKVRIHTILELVGTPKNHIEKTIELLVKQLNEQDGIEIEEKEVSDAQKTEDGMFGAFAELTMQMDDLTTLNHFAVNYTPAAIELLEPQELEMNPITFNEVYGDILAKLHMSNTEIVELKNQRKEFLRSLNSLLRNTILILLEQEGRTAKQIATQTGVDLERTEKVLEAMINNDTIHKEDDVYRMK